MKRTAFLLAIPILFIVTLPACTRDDEGLHNVIYNAVTDVDGNSYDAVRIGEQVWMKSNLRTSHFRDGSEISGVEIGYFDTYDTIPRYYSSHVECPLGNSYENESCKIEGFEYNRAAVADDRGLCPEGWHVPDDQDWIQLKQYVSSRNEWCYNGVSGSIAKALASKNYWNDWVPDYMRTEGSPYCHPEENNATGFSAVPRGCQWWSSTEELHTTDYASTVENHQWGLCWGEGDCCSLGMAIIDYYIYNGYNPVSVRCLRD